MAIEVSEPAVIEIDGDDDEETDEQELGNLCASELDGMYPFTRSSRT